MVLLNLKEHSAKASGEAFIRDLYSLSLAAFADPRKKLTSKETDFTDQFVLALRTAEEAYYRDFVTSAVATMALLVRSEHGHAPEALARAFDKMDDIFDLHYDGEPVARNLENAGERLYEGAGAGVQTSYATLLEILERLNLPPNAHITDLGSGYGRLGLVAGLWRRDLVCSGYEFVSHRAHAANAAAARCGTAERVKFYHQDLGNDSFMIPEADVYYMYDPFSDDTYEKVLARLCAVGKSRKIAIVTKAILPETFLKFVKNGEFREGGTFDSGNVRLLHNL